MRTEDRDTSRGRPRSGRDAIRAACPSCRPWRDSESVRRGTDGEGRWDATAIACGRSVVVGFSAPITGQVAAAGAQMVKGSIRPDALEQGESAEPDPARHGRHGRRTPRRVRAAEGRVQPVDACCRRAGRKPGDRGLDGTVSQGRAGEHLGHGHADRPHDLRHAARVLLPHRPERRATGVEGGRVHARHPAGEQSRRHRCAEQLQRRSVRRRRASAGRRGSPRSASP